MRDFRIFFLKVGNGHCSYIEFPNGENALIDVKVCDEDNSLDNIIDILKEVHITTIDLLIITHPHRDHIGGLSKLVNNFTIKSFIHSPVEFTPDPIYNDWEIYKDMKQGYHCNKACEVMHGWKSTIDDARIDYIAPSKTFLDNWPDDVNNNGLVLSVSCRGHKIIIPGDTEKDGWDYIADSSIENSTLLLAPHHGNKSGFHLEKMKRVNPGFVVISAGSKTEHDADGRYRNIANKNIYTTRQSRTVARIDEDRVLHMIG